MFDYWRDHPHPLTITERRLKNREAAVRRLERMRARKEPMRVSSRPWGKGLWSVQNSHDLRTYGPFPMENMAQVSRLMFAGEWSREWNEKLRAPDEVIYGRSCLDEGDEGEGEAAAA
ncbi:hypothetical protein ACFOGJ_24335 [Marinibaculum pumilum]|uniref:Uncharacterized protein n=1 Tax=Marinibaculum pumilum TaxID=1766165 RepID=A0ABV7L7T0_9PROT